MSILLNPYAYQGKSLVHAKDALRGDEPFRCVCCNDLLILRRGKIKQPHFAHHEGTSCKSETVLHKLAKEKVHQLLSEHFQNFKVIDFNIDCQWCKSTHTRTYYIQRPIVHLEKSLDIYRPDIQVCDGSKPLFTVEIIVKHKPEESYQDYCSSRGIPIIPILFSSFEELDSITLNGIQLDLHLSNSLFYKCQHPHFAVEKHQAYTETYKIHEGPCWYCEKDIRFLIPPHLYTKSLLLPIDIIDSAVTMGVKLARRPSMYGYPLLFNICQYCDTTQQNLFLDIVHNKYPKVLSITKRSCIQCSFFEHEIQYFNDIQDKKKARQGHIQKETAARSVVVGNLNRRRTTLDLGPRNGRRITGKPARA